MDKGLCKPLGFIFDQVASQRQTARPDVVLNDVNHDVRAAPVPSLRSGGQFFCGSPTTIKGAQYFG